MRYMLKNVAAICEAAGTTLENVVRRACFHDSGERFAESMEEWAVAFPGSQAVLDDTDHRRPAGGSRRPHAPRSDGLRSGLRYAAARARIRQACLGDCRATLQRASPARA